MAAEALLLVMFLLFAVAGPLLLWQLVQSESDEGPGMDRGSAERAARRDARDEPRR